jgi:hypothetical protein
MQRVSHAARERFAQLIVANHTSNRSPSTCSADALRAGPRQKAKKAAAIERRRARGEDPK